jgi:UDP-N-acetylmuramoyl-tripeptide--D-alanyl-D-alanine ligase
MQNSNNNTLSSTEKKKFIQLRRKFLKPVIGVAGYLGKTTLIEMISSVLETRGRVLKTPRGNGSWENNLRTLEKLDDHYDYAIFEFDYQRGKNFAGLLRLIKPNIAVVTNIGDAHLTYLKDAMKLALKRSEVVNYIAREGVAILNQDDDMSSSLSKYISTPHVYKYGMNHIADFNASNIHHMGPGGIRFTLNNEQEITLPVYSVSYVYSFLACAATCTNLDFTIDEIVELIHQNFELPKGRGNLHKINSTYLIDESYLGTSRSVSKAARTLVGFKAYTKKVVLILGDMTEQGVKVEDRHLNMGYFLSALPIDYIITLGHYAEFIAKGVTLIQSSKQVFTVKNVSELLDTLDDIFIPNMAVSVKGLGNVVFHRIKTLIENKKITEGHVT